MNLATNHGSFANSSHITLGPSGDKESNIAFTLSKTAETDRRCWLSFPGSRNSGGWSTNHTSGQIMIYHSIIFDISGSYEKWQPFKILQVTHADHWEIHPTSSQHFQHLGPVLIDRSGFYLKCGQLADSGWMCHIHDTTTFLALSGH